MKVLIISHNPITTYENMGKTMLVLFHALREEELCQLYIYPNTPDVDVCHSYFRISDRDILRSYFHWGKVQGREIDKTKINPNNSMFETQKDADTYRETREWVRWLRDRMWKLARWDNGSLREWIEREKPDCIFVAPGNAEFLYDITQRIAERYELPLITYLCDDFYFTLRPKNFWARKRSEGVHRCIEKLMKKTSCAVCITEEMARAVEERFRIPCRVIMTGTSSVAETLFEKEPETLVYMGNLRHGRNTSLAEIGSSLEQLNQRLGTCYKLAIYSSETNAQVLSVFQGLPAVELMGFVQGDAYRKAFSDAAAFVHVEGFSEEDVDRVKFSLSTKIAEILGSGKPLLAYGSAQVASIRHLLLGEAACVITDKDRLTAGLHRFLSDREYRLALEKNAIRLAREKHDIDNNALLIKDIVSGEYGV